MAGMTEEYLYKMIESVVDKKLSEQKQKKSEDVFDINPYEATIADWENLIKQMRQVTPEKEDVLYDNYSNIWYNRLVARLLEDMSYGKKEDYSMMISGYWTPIIFETVEKFFNTRKKVVENYKGFAKMFVKEMKSEIFGKKGGEKKDAEAPKSAQKEARHYACQYPTREHIEDMMKKINFAYNHAIMDELRAHGAEA